MAGWTMQEQLSDFVSMMLDVHVVGVINGMFDEHAAVM